MKYIEKIVDDILQKYRTSDPFAICEQMGIFTYTAQLPPSLHGFYFCTADGKMICIKSGLSEKQRTVTCAHELGHAVLHPSLNSLFMKTQTYLEPGKYEREADYFCACMLLGNAAADMYGGAETYTVEDMARETGLTEEMIAMKFRFS